MNKTTVSIEILGKIYQIKCPPEEIESLKKAAKLLEEKMRATREDSHIVSNDNDKVAVITSLNLIHQVTLLEQQLAYHTQTTHQRLQKIQDKVEIALAQHAQMELTPAE